MRERAASEAAARAEEVATARRMAKEAAKAKRAAEAAARVAEKAAKVKRAAEEAATAKLAAEEAAKAKRVAEEAAKAKRAAEAAAAAAEAATKQKRRNPGRYSAQELARKYGDNLPEYKPPPAPTTGRASTAGGRLAHSAGPLDDDGASAWLKSCARSRDDTEADEVRFVAITGTLTNAGEAGVQVTPSRRQKPPPIFSVVPITEMKILILFGAFFSPCMLNGQNELIAKSLTTDFLEIPPPPPSQKIGANGGRVVAIGARVVVAFDRHSLLLRTFDRLLEDLIHIRPGLRPFFSIAKRKGLR